MEDKEPKSVIGEPDWGKISVRLENGCSHLMARLVFKIIARARDWGIANQAIFGYRE